MNILNCKFPTCIQQIDYDKSPVNGQFFFVGSIPVKCLGEDGRSQIYPTINAAERALLMAGVAKWQRPDCSWRTKLECDCTEVSLCPHGNGGLA